MRNQAPHQTGLRGAVSVASGPAVISLDGTADFATLATLRHLLRQAPNHRDVVVDCEHLTFADSAAVRAFVEKAQQLEPDGHRLTLRHPSPLLHHVVQISGLDRVFLID